MDKKELLRRWTLGYVEPSLFYLPQRKPTPMCTVRLQFMEIFYANGTWEYTYSLTDRAETIIGAIFSIDNKFVSYVTPNYTNVTFLTTLKKGTYVFKEAVSPKGCLLAEDTVFSVDNTYQTIQIKHKRNGFEIVPTMGKSEDHENDYKEIINDDKIEVINSEYEINERYNIFYNFHSLYDNSLIRKIEDAEFQSSFIHMGNYRNISNLGYIFPYINENNNTSLLHLQNSGYLSSKFGKFEYMQSEGYSDKYRRTLVTLSFLTVQQSEGYNYSWVINLDDTIRFQGKFSSGFVYMEDYADYLSRPDDFNPDTTDWYIMFVHNLTKEQLMDIYQFAMNNVSPKATTDKNGILVSSRIVWIGEDGKYYANGADAGYIHYINVITRSSYLFSNLNIPIKIMFSDTKNISINDLFDSQIIAELSGNEVIYEYQKYFITDYKDDISIYFHGIENLSYEEILKDPLIKISGSTFQVFTQEFTNERLLAEINSYIKDGD